MNKLTTPLLFSVIFFCSCRNENIGSRNIDEPCYCDSIYYNRKGQNKVVLCYKGIDVYKLKYENGNPSVLSRHNVQSSKYLFERLNLLDGKTDPSSSFYLKSNEESNSFKVTLVGPRVDSITVSLSNLKDLVIFNKTALSNTISINKKYLSDTVDLKLVGHETVSRDPLTREAVKRGVLVNTMKYISIQLLNCIKII